MTAQEWLEELERLRKAATPGPWSKSEQGTNGTYHHRIERYYGGKEVPEHIAYVFLPNAFGNLHDAAYIVAACNAVPRLIKMLKLEACLLECPYEDEKCPYDEDNTVSCAHCKVQRLYELTEPTE